MNRQAIATYECRGSKQGDRVLEEFVWKVMLLCGISRQFNK